MGNYAKEDIDRWFDYSYLSSLRMIHVGSHDAGISCDDGESGTDCQMSEFFIKAILHLNRISKKPIFVHMNNLGGDWYHGMAMYDAIRASRAHVYGICWGYAMSMGSIIIQACDSRIVAPHCTFMVHDGFENLSGTCRSVEAWAKNTAKLRKRMYQIYLNRVKQAKPRMTLDKIENLCSHDTILSANEAVSFGLADWVLESLNDPYQYYATKEQDAKWQPAIKPGKHETEDDNLGEDQ